MKIFFKTAFGRTNIKYQVSNIVSHQLFTGSMIMIAGSNVVNFLNYIYHLIIGRILGPSNYGELAALISLMGLISIVPASINLVIVKYISAAKTETEVADLVIWLKNRIIKFSIIFFVIILLISPLIVSFLRVSKIIYLILFALTFLVGFQSLFYRAILQGLLKFKEMIFSILAENSIKLIASVLFIYLGFRVGGAVAAFLISAIIGWGITVFYLKVKTKRATNIHPDIKSMALFAIPVIIQSFATTSLYSSDVLLVKHFFSSHDAGIYASLSTLGKIIFFAAGPIGAVMFPLVSQRNAKGGNYKKIFRYSFIFTFITSCGILSAYWLFPQIAIRILYGALYLEAANLLFYFGIFIALFTLSSLIINYGLSLGRTKIVILPTVAAFVQIIGIWFFHNSLSMVIIISIIVSALLLLSLLIYSGLWKKDLRQPDRFL